MKNILKQCTLCPRECRINRYQGKGFCGANNKIKIARASLHYYEEPSISGENGSGTIFFSGCNLQCVFCQNREISKNNFGKEISIKRLSEIMLELQEKKANNINLVTPTQYIPQIIKAIKQARKNGLTIPIIYNTSGYEKKESLKLLRGYIDVYLPDFKYYNDEYAIKYSNAKNYQKYVKEAIDEMYFQTGSCKFNKDGLIKKGIIVRHLMLPTLKEDTKEILKYLYETYQDNIYISIMNQYTPPKNIKFNELKNSIKDLDYNEIIDYALDLGIINAYCQMDGTVSESFIPKSIIILFSFGFDSAINNVNAVNVLLSITKVLS